MFGSAAFDWRAAKKVASLVGLSLDAAHRPEIPYIAVSFGIRLADGQTGWAMLGFRAAINPQMKY